MRYTEAPGRRTELLRRLADDGYVSSAQFAAEFRVSEMTVRRDLRQLEIDGLARRVVGGARQAQGATPFEERDRAGSVQKQAIAAACAELLAEARVVALDAGTTVVPLVARLAPGTVVVSHSAPVLAAAIARGDLDVHAVGGQYSPESRAYLGAAATAALAGFAIDVAVLSATAVDATGVLSASVADAEIKRAMADAAGSAILVADAGKLGARAPVRVMPLSRVGTLVTDAAAAPDAVQRIEAAGTRVVLAGVA